MPIQRLFRRLALLCATCLLTLVSACHIRATQANGVTLPQGWRPYFQPSVSGAFLRPGAHNVAMLVRNEEQHLSGVLVLTFVDDSGTASVIKTFKEDDTNPPKLSLLQPGNYRPACHQGGPCQPTHIANEAISLCFGEASCAILYAEGDSFRELAVSD
ncbi:MAG: hypothetical protein ABW202_23870 [Duganella sp.]